MTSILQSGQQGSDILICSRNTSTSGVLGYGGSLEPDSEDGSQIMTYSEALSAIEPTLCPYGEDYFAHTTVHIPGYYLPRLIMASYRKDKLWFVEVSSTLEPEVVPPVEILSRYPHIFADDYNSWNLIKWADTDWPIGFPD